MSGQLFWWFEVWCDMNILFLTVLDLSPLSRSMLYCQSSKYFKKTSVSHNSLIIDTAKRDEKWFVIEFDVKSIFWSPEQILKFEILIIKFDKVIFWNEDLYSVYIVNVWLSGIFQQKCVILNDRSFHVIYFSVW